ncbi:Pol protein, partial [Phytophthora palmivora]
MRPQAQCTELQQLELAPGRYPWNWGLEGPVAEATTQEPGEDLSPHGRSANGARYGGLAPESLGALETRKSSGGLLVVHASTVARNGDKYADALRESKGRGQVSVRLANGTVVNVPGVRMDLAVKFEDFDSTESFLVLDMDKYDLILGMPWLEKHEPWIDWRDPAVSDRALVSNVPTSVRDWGARDGRQGAYVPEELLGVTDSNEDVAMSLATVPDGTDQAGNIGPQAGSVVPQAGNIGPQAAEAAGEDAESASGVGNIVPHEVKETEKKIESAACVSSVGNRVPRGVKKTSTSAEVSLSTSRVDNQVPHSESETPETAEVSALLNLEELSMKDFLVALKAGEIAEMVLLKPETSPEDLNSSSVMDEDVLEGFTKQRATRLGSEILKNP